MQGTIWHDTSLPFLLSLASGNRRKVTAVLDIGSQVLGGPLSSSVSLKKGKKPELGKAWTQTVVSSVSRSRLLELQDTLLGENTCLSEDR